MNADLTRIIQIVSGLAAPLALFNTFLMVSSQARIFWHHFDEVLGGTPLPSLTAVVFTFAPRAPLFGGALILLYVLAAFFILRAAPSQDSASTRLLALVTLTWLLCVLMLAMLSISTAMPLVQTTINIQHP